MRAAYRLAGNDDEGQVEHNNDDNGAETTPVSFKGKCQICKKMGHKAKQCPTKIGGMSQGGCIR